MSEGRVRRALRERLESLGLEIAPGHELSTTTGGTRRWSRFDDTTVCWDTWILRPGYPFPIQLVSYDTMAQCAKGCRVVFGSGSDPAWCYADRHGETADRVPA